MKTNLSRRHFIKIGTIVGAGLPLFPSVLKGVNNSFAGNPVRLGGPAPGKYTDPVEWAKAIKSLKYSTTLSPVQPGAPGELIKAFREEAKKSNIVIAEVGAFGNNIMNPDMSARKEAISKNIAALQLADEIGARCCVNTSGASGEVLNGPSPGIYSKATFDLLIETVRYIIDQVKPVNTFYTLEAMPFMLPDSPDSYLEIMKAVDRKQFAAHFDPVNMISTPQRYFNNALFLKECFARLGPYIKSIHAKDVTISKGLVHLEERRPGLGSLDYTVFLQEASKLKDIPVILEHLNTQEEYKLAADHIREVGNKAGIRFL
jgi:sugar phosphate isomerase/epimerase